MASSFDADARTGGTRHDQRQPHRIGGFIALAALIIGLFSWQQSDIGALRGEIGALRGELAAMFGPLAGEPVPEIGP